MADNDPYFPRPVLAQGIADKLLDPNALGHTPNLFLTAPRRTGKSMFLRRDLVPELERRDVHTIYVDLWSDRSRDPAELISEAISRELAKTDSLATKGVRGLAETVPVRAINVPGVGGVELGTASKQKQPTLTYALQLLCDRLAKRLQGVLQPVVLIIDEAQHARTTQPGRDAVFALKAARDAINQDARKDRRLLLVMTGSNRNKLSEIALRRKQAFYGASIQDFPQLQDDFVDWLVERVNARLQPAHHLDSAEAKRAFEILGRKPERLRQAIEHSALGGDEASLTDHATALRDEEWIEFEETFNSLPRLEQAVLQRILAGETQLPFGEAALRDYAQVTGQKPGTSAVQSAFRKLQDAEILWLQDRGTYALEDEGWRGWFETRRPASTTDSGATPG